MFAPNCVVLVPNPELSIKSSVVRAFMNKKLKKNIQLYLKHAGVEGAVFKKFGGRMVIYHSDAEKVLGALLKCFGIHSLHLAHMVEYSSLGDLCATGCGLSEGNVAKGTFAVRGKSFNKNFSSKKLEEELGGALLASIGGLKVNLSNPASEVFCIAQDKKAFFYFNPVKGAGGMPVGCQRRACVILNKQDSERKEDIFSLVFSILKCGSSVSFAGDGVVPKSVEESLVEFNVFREFRHLSMSEANDMLKEGELEAFFSLAKSCEDSKKDSDISGVKVFAPFIGGAVRFSALG